MAKTIDDHKRILSFEQNEVFDAVLAFLDASVEAEVDRAIAYSTEGEKRIHACGRAESLKDFKDLLLSVQLEARKER
ncbi:hypothetical protein UFOVP340_47 [uncultured Caudovirales phage]|jgi:hypothetical protein|uniref:Uncharacterized protein n=1 Tax=uncultured Caudovirales phage TaxID=2100421 RepID=A0A6J5LYE7_9CAUD|nr:hypothetical protein UFOVP340_47 [uncultured Caudovirales phage]